MRLPTIADVRDAAERIKGQIHRTPVLTSSSLDTLAGANLFFKCENLQKVGAFKIRGATNAVFQLTEEEAAKGVATHSSGNHGAALAMATKSRGIPAFVVMPENASKVKREAVAAYGGQVVTCGTTLASREEILNSVLQKTGAVYIPPYNHPHIISGQGTAALELLEQVRDLDVILAPVGGGGLLSGTAITAKALMPEVQVWGAEPVLANDAYLSLQAGKIIPVQSTQTIADGLRTSLGDLTFAIIQEKVTSILTVSEDDIIRAMRLLWERMKIVVEPSGALPLAAVLVHPEKLVGKRVGLILSGGNVDLDRLPWIERK